MTETREAELMCVLCGLIVTTTWYEDDTGNRSGVSESYPSRCSLNGGGDHIRPDDAAAEQALEVRRKWLAPG